jgi:hypothetical protein
MAPPVVATPEPVPDIKDIPPVPPPSDNGHLPVEVLADISHINPVALKQAGFKTIADVKRDIESNGGRGLLAIHYVGRKTVGKIKELIYANA